MSNRRSVEGEYRVEGSVLDELGFHHFPMHLASAPAAASYQLSAVSKIKGPAARRGFLVGRREPPRGKDIHERDWAAVARVAASSWA